MTDYALRAAVPSDAERMVAVTVEGFESYYSFAPAAWSPPSREDELERLPRLLADANVWYQVAERDGQLVGHVGFLPATSSLKPLDDPAMGHFRQLFVARAHWGTGLATTLHAAAIREAAARGFATMRLFTPALQARARRFYQREGWVLARQPAFEELIGLDMAEYQRSLLQ